MNPGRASRSYSALTLKMLWGRAAGRCAMPDCRIDLILDATEKDPAVPIGQIAHNVAASNGGPRSDPTMPHADRNDYENLILLCPTCHAKLDRQKNTNTVEFIRRLKSDHEVWVKECLPERGRSTVGWTVVLLQGRHPIDPEPAITALTPDFPRTDPVIMTLDPASMDWKDVYTTLECHVKELIVDEDPASYRVAVFPLANITTLIAFGYLVTNRPRVRLFQYHRDEQSWAWKSDTADEPEIQVYGTPDESKDEAEDLAIRFCLSARVTDDQIAALDHEFACTITVSVPSPSTSWLTQQKQLHRISSIARQVFESCADRFPNCRRWHLFCAVPAPVAVSIGQQLNLTMTPAIQLYEFNRALIPSYQPSLEIGGCEPWLKNRTSAAC